MLCGAGWKLVYLLFSVDFQAQQLSISLDGMPATVKRIVSTLCNTLKLCLNCQQYTKWFKSFKTYSNLTDVITHDCLQSQLHCMSPVVVFKYKAAPVSPGESSILEGAGDNGSDQDDEQGKIYRR